MAVSTGSSLISEADLPSTSGLDEELPSQLLPPLSVDTSEIIDENLLRSQTPLEGADDEQHQKLINVRCSCEALMYRAAYKTHILVEFV